MHRTISRAVAPAVRTSAMRSASGFTRSMTRVRRSSIWDDPLGADLTAGEADQIEAEGKDPASCLAC